MNIFALDTSTEYCSLALWLDGEILSRSVLAGQKHSELVLPMLDEMLIEGGLTLHQLHGFAFGAGPGSFTGLRIACGVIQGLAFALNKPVVAISTLEALAKQVDSPSVLAALDARMGEIYFAAYTKDPSNNWIPFQAPMLCRPEHAPLIAGNGWVGCGSGFDRYRDVLNEVYRDRLSQVVADSYPHAREIAQLSITRFEQGLTLLPEQAVPIYIRNKVALKECER